MADILLTVGVDTSLSYAEFQSGITSLVSQINGNPPKIKVKFDESSLTSMRQQIESLHKAASNSSSLKFDGYTQSSSGIWLKDTAAIKANTQAKQENANASKKAASAAKDAASSEDSFAVGTKKHTDALNKVNTLLGQVTANTNKWTAASKGSTSGSYANLKSQITALKDLQMGLQNGSVSAEQFNARFGQIKSTVTASSAAIRAAGENTKTFGESIGGLAQKFTTWFGLTRIIMSAVHTCKQMVSASIELDTAMTELKKVTNETDATYAKFLTNASSRAKELGASLTDTVTATADFARLGFGIKEAEKLADAATIYKNVGDGITDISDASASIIATMQAFGVEASDAMSIVDKFNEVGNNYAISSEGVGEALLRSAAAMKAANNTLDETIALATAANTIVQDPAKVGTTLKTVSMYLRAAKTEAEESGEATDGMASSVSELREEILQLTGNKVDIQIDDDTFKSTYQILKELSGVWGELTDVTQANILELVGGKRNSNVVAALLENFSVAENALETSAGSAGSALAENEKYLDSIQGKISILKASFQTFSSNLADGDLIKFFVEGATAILDFLNGVTQVIDALGGLKTVLVATAGIMATIKADALIRLITTTIPGALKALVSPITKVITIISRIPTVFKSFSSGTAVAVQGTSRFSAALQGLGISASGAQLAIGAVTAALTIAIAAYSAWRNKLEQQRQEAIDAAHASAEESANIMSLYSTYRTANAAYESNTGSKDALTESTNALLSALGFEESEIQSLISKYGDLDTAIDSITLDSLQQAAKDAQTGFNAAYDNLQDSFGNGSDWVANIKKHFGFGTGADIISWSEETEKLQSKVKDILTKSGTITEGMAGPLGGTFMLDTDSVDGVLESYDKLIKARDALQEGLTEEEYNDSGAVDMIEGKIADFDSILSEYLDARDLLNESLAKEDIFESISKNGIPQTSSELNKLKESLISAAEQGDKFSGTGEDIATAFDNAFNELGGYIPELSGAINQSAELADSVSEIYTQASENITQTAEAASEAATTLISGISAAQEAIGSQQTGKSISLADFNSDELKDYRSALEYVNGTMQLNADKVKEIAQAKAEEQVAINNTNKALEQTKYLENAKQIEQYRQKLRDANFAEGETASSVQSNIDALLAENSAIAETCKQYDLLSASIQEAVGAYQNWLNSQSASDYGDMASDAVSAIKQIRDTYDSDSEIFGNYGSKKFEAAVDFIVPESVDRDDLGAIESYMSDFKKYLTFDKDGNTDGLNIDKFLEDSVNAGLMSYSDDDGFKVLGGKKMEDFAEGLNMSSGMVQAFFDELQLKGAEFDWSDEAVKSIGDLAVEANEAAESLRQMDGNSDLKIKMDVSDLATTEEQISALDATIAEMDAIKARPDVDASSIENANAVIQYCLTQKQLLSQPDVMRVDTSKVEGDIANAISLLQQFQTAQNDLEIKSKVGVDTTDAESKVNTLASQIQGLSPDIKASLNIDSTSVESIRTSIAGLSAETINVKANVDASAITGYNPETKNCDVVYNPKTDALPTSFADINRTVNYVPVTSSLPSSFSTITRYVNYVKTGDVSVNGTAHASGTARASGDWGTAPGGPTLVGELGQEIVVDPHTGKWYTVGDNGAEFRDIPAGAIVFNHIQSKQLLENGYVAGRASALVSGTAMVTGGYKPYKPSGGGSSSSSNKGSSSSSSSSSKGSSSSSSSKSSSSKSYNSSNNSSSEKDDSEVIDWIEIAIDRIERAIDRLAVTATSPFKTLATRLQATNDELVKMSNELSLQQSAYNRYMQQASSVGLSSDLASKVQNGTIDITEYDGDTADKIKDYQEWYEKALDCKDAMDDLAESIAELYESKFSDVASDYENQLSLLEHLTTTYDNGIDDLEERGYLASTKYYAAMQKVEKQNIDVRKKELNALIKHMSEGVNSGSIKEGSEAWYDMQKEINSVKEAIQEAETSIISLGNSIREVEWGHFDYLQEQISNITKESDFLIDLMENSELFTDNGQLTETGMASMGLHGQNYNVYMAQADKYAEELKKLNEEITNDPNNTILLERREELLDAQRDSILAAEDEKQAIRDMVEEGIELELDALQKLIDSYTEALDSSKDLYDYQKKVQNQASEVARLQKQIAAYAGDTSEENRALKQKLEVDLSEAMEDLEETQYEHYISEQKQLLDSLYDEYEMILNQRLDNIDALMSDMIDTINANSSSICDTLISESEKVGYTLSENEKAIWANEGGAGSIITKYGEAFTSALTSVNTVLNSIAANIAKMAGVSDSTADSVTDNTTSKTEADKTVKPPTTTTPPKPQTPAKKTPTEKENYGVALAIWNGNYGWGTGNTRVSRLKAKGFDAGHVQSIVNQMGRDGYIRSGAWVGKYYGITSLAPYHYNKFKKGGLVDYTGIAQVDGTPGEPELVLNAKDTANFIELKDALRSVANGTSPLLSIFGDDSASDIVGGLGHVNTPSGARQATTIGDITYEVNIPIDHVSDYNDFMNQMRKDGKFEKMIQSMTIDRLVGGSKLSKNRFQW